VSELSARTSTVVEGRSERIVFCTETGGRVTGFPSLALAVACVVALLEGRFDR
jgi:hypothetical protein